MLNLASPSLTSLAVVKRLGAGRNDDTKFFREAEK